MDQDFINKMEKTLREMKTQIIKNLASESEAFKAAIEDLEVKDPVDVAANDIDKRTLQAVGLVELKRLSQVDAALARIKQGIYGRCANCKKKISKERLEAIPYATMCIDCTTRFERQNS